MKGRTLLSWALLLNLLISCSGSSSFPSLLVPSAKPSDSLAYLLSVGDSLSRQDTLRFVDKEPMELNPDTSLYNQAYVIYPKTNKVLYFSLQGDAWEESSPKSVVDTMPKTLPYTVLVDIYNKARNSIELSRGKLACYVFSNHKGEVLSKSERERITKTYVRDSIQFVYLYLSPRDSLVKVWSKRDSLKGVFVSDSLNEVSKIRQLLGIGRSAKARAFVVDSTQKILKQL